MVTSSLDPLVSYPLGYSQLQQSWLVLGYGLGREALVHPALTPRPLSVAQVRETDSTRSLYDQALFQHGADHTRLRAPIVESLTPKLGSLHTSLGHSASYFLQQSIDAGVIDLERFAASVTLHTLASMLGLEIPPAAHLGKSSPDEVEQMRSRLRKWQIWSDALGNLTTGFPSLTAIRHFKAMKAAFESLLAQRRLQPAGDMATMFATHPHFHTEDERAINAMMLLGAGSGTTTSAVVNGLVMLLQQDDWPDLQRELQANPGYLRNLEQEILRLEPPTRYVVRWATEQLKLGGEMIGRDQKVMILLDAMNRDPEVFQQPDQFDLQRANAKQHLSFGTGPHECPGRPPALAELLEILRQLIDLPGLALVPGQHLEVGENKNQKRYQHVILQYHGTGA